MTDDVAKLRRHRELGVNILMDSRKATSETADEIVKRIHTWERDLISLVEPFGPGAAGRFKPLTPMLLEEQLAVAPCTPLDDGFNLHRIEHAVRVYRLGELFKQFPPVLPKGKGGNRPRYNDGPILEIAYGIIESSGTENKTGAVREAIRLHPELVEKGASPESTLKRITRKMQ